MDAATWKSKGQLINVAGRSIFVVDEGRRDAPVLLISHGYPSCSYDYWKVLPILSSSFRVIVHDHIGFGFSDKPSDYSYSLIDQAEMAMALWQKMGIQKAHLIGHDYGTSVLTEIIARWNFGFRPIQIQSITLGNGSMLIDMSQLLLSQKILVHKTFGPLLAKVASRGYFQYNMKKLWADPAKYDAQELDVIFDINFNTAGRKVLSKITRYILERYQFYTRWLDHGLYKTDIPIHLYWADQDPVAVIAMAHRLQKNLPHCTLDILEEVGHYPMLETPERWAKIILNNLKPTTPS